MDEVALRTLRNETSTVLHRIEAGEQLVVTVNRRRVALLSPLPGRPSWSPGEKVWATIRARQADAGMAVSLTELLGDRIDSL